MVSSLYLHSIEVWVSYYVHSPFSIMCLAQITAVLLEIFRQNLNYLISRQWGYKYQYADKLKRTRFSKTGFVLSVWWCPHREWVIGYFHSSVGCWVGELFTYIDWSPVTDQWTRIERQHTGLRKCWLHSQSMGHHYRPVSADSTRYFYKNWTK